MKINTSSGEIFAYSGSKPHKKGQKAIIFVHGTGMDHTVWVLPSRYFARHGFNVLALDLPAHGKSKGNALQTIDGMADSVIDTMNSVDFDNAILVGHSMGSLVTLNAAARYSDRVKSLALIGITAPMGVHPKMLQSAANNDHLVIDMLTYWGYSKSAQLGGNENPGIWMAGTTQRLLERACDDIIHTDLTACASYETGIEDAKKIKCPTLFILGGRDNMTPVRSAQELVHSISGARTEIITGSGHSLMMEKPDAVLDALITVVS